MDWIEPLLPLVDSDREMRPDERAAAARESLEFQGVLEDVMFARRPEDDLNDFLRLRGLDPDAYWQDVESDIDAVIRAGLVPDALEYSPSGLVVPRYD